MSEDLSLHSIVGRSNLKQQLMNALADQSVHCVLLVGEQGMGKHYVAKRIAASLLCQQPQRGVACCNCDACRYLSLASHPDYHELFLEEGSVIKVERLRQEVLANLLIKPHISKRQVFVIEVDQLNEAGQNALLKSLEEPPATVAFILLANTSEKVLATVKSRALQLQLEPLTQQQIAQVLEQFAIDANSEAGRDAQNYCAGNPGRALQLAEDEEFKQLRWNSLTWFYGLTTVPRHQLLLDGFTFFETNRSDFATILAIWEVALRDLALIACNQSPKYADTKEDLKRMLPKFERETILERINKALKLLGEVLHSQQLNVNYELTIGYLLLNLRRLLR